MGQSFVMLIFANVVFIFVFNLGDELDLRLFCGARFAVVSSPKIVHILLDVHCARLHCFQVASTHSVARCTATPRA